MNVKLIILFRLAISAAAILLFGQAGAEAQSSASSPMGRYSSPSTYCGPGSPRQNVDTIPWIGCFSLTAGHRAAGSLSGQRVEVAVDQDGREVFTVNGTVLTHTFGANRTPSRTNLPNVRLSGAGYSFCDDEAGNYCGVNIGIFSRNPDKSVLFMVAECLPPHGRLCALDQENWDYEKSRQEMYMPTPNNH